MVEKDAADQKTREDEKEIDTRYEEWLDDLKDTGGHALVGRFPDSREVVMYKDE
ncbi:hypothetical protein MMOR_38220 [Mycolicibacterium moriokaense]|uniref:Uncharacterized protein n=1 Tax=Mycolicibacterium moriokaense TaxID=39691 RepID=A0AAD1HEK2_9MYCO|nr:hypothetical protein MMOR_38220 [Mycolicibacterium moriokaense]